MQKSVSKFIYDELSKLEDELDEVFHDEDTDTPDEPEKLKYKISKIPAGINTIIDKIALAEGLTRIVTLFNKTAMERGVDYEMGKLQSKLEDFADEPLNIELRFDIKDTLAYKKMEETAGMNMRHVDMSVKQSVRDTLLNVADEGGTITDARNSLIQNIDTLSKSRAELVSRTETLSASRHGTQALCEGTDLISHKRWLSSDDGRERTWHKVMHDTVIPKDENFIVPKIPPGQLKRGETQPKEYPKEAYVVGADQPFNCRCAQQPVLAEEVKNLDLANYQDKGITITPLSKEQYLLREFGESGETFEDMIARMDNKYSRAQATRMLNISKPTFYKYLKQYNLM